MQYDILIIGGSFAGQAASLQLGRARRRVLLVDDGKPRNRFARSSHGFLGQDGQPPATIIATAKKQLSRYETVELREAKVQYARPQQGSFQVLLSDGTEVTASKLILATGVRDKLPQMSGLAERWGVSVLHCPYCHGYELDKRPLGVLASNSMAMHQAMLVPDWGQTTLFTQNAFIPSSEQLDMLHRRGVNIERTPIVELLGNSPDLEAVRLVDGRIIKISGLFIFPETEPACDLAEQLGCAYVKGPSGVVISVNAQQETSIPGVFAAGDAALPVANATLAAASGVMAASGAHYSLIHQIEEKTQ